MQLAFLGTGAAFSAERYNGAVAVDGHLLLDAGAPLVPHLHRVGIEPSAIDVVFISHFHGDHVAGLIPYLCGWAFAPEPARRRGLTIVGPITSGEGIGARVDRLLRAAWGQLWEATIRPAFALRYQDAGGSGEVAGVRYETVPLEHGEIPGLGYRLQIGDHLLAYSGDTRATPALDRLVDGAEVAITEATAPEVGGGHTSWSEAAALAARHPATRFFFNHVESGTLPGAATDLQVVDV
jgi:ribonuclease BN (tRNA processing enzyme)